MLIAPPTTFHVVIGLDFSPLAELALAEAAATAARESSATLHVVTVVDANRAASAVAEETSRIRDLVTATLCKSDSKADVQIDCHVRHGDPAGEILSLAGDVNAALIVVGTHGRRGVKRLVMGSVAEKVVRQAPCPVLVMRRRGNAEADLVPEPPCPDCDTRRAESRGASWWCQSHDRPWVPPHRYTYRDGALHPFHTDGLGPD